MQEGRRWWCLAVGVRFIDTFILGSDVFLCRTTAAAAVRGSVRRLREMVEL